MQRRHWIHTIHFRHLDVVDGDEEAFHKGFGELWIELEKDTRLRYACGQIERGEEGRLHAQIYTEWKTSMRRNQVTAALPSHAEPREGTRSQARDYCRKSDGRECAMPDLGEWRAERGNDTFGKQRGPKQRALELITVQGLNPFEIAVEDPEAYFTFSTAIHRLYDALKVSGALPARVLPKAALPISPEGGEEE